MKKEIIYFSTFTTKKCLISRINRTYRNEYENEKMNKKPIIIITSTLSLKETTTFEFKFENEEVAVAVYNEILKVLNESEDTDFINFDDVINPIKEKFNTLIEDVVM